MSLLDRVESAPVEHESGEAWFTTADLDLLLEPYGVHTADIPMGGLKIVPCDPCQPTRLALEISVLLHDPNGNSFLNSDHVTPACRTVLIPLAGAPLLRGL